MAIDFAIDHFAIGVLDRHQDPTGLNDVGEQRRVDGAIEAQTKELMVLQRGLKMGRIDQFLRDFALGIEEDLAEGTLLDELGMSKVSLTKPKRNFDEVSISVKFLRAPWLSRIAKVR